MRKGHCPRHGEWLLASCPRQNSRAPLGHRSRTRVPAAAGSAPPFPTVWSSSRPPMKTQGFGFPLSPRTLPVVMEETPWGGSPRGVTAGGSPHPGPFPLPTHCTHVGPSWVTFAFHISSVCSRVPVSSCTEKSTKPRQCPKTCFPPRPVSAGLAADSSLPPSAPRWTQPLGRGSLHPVPHPRWPPNLPRSAAGHHVQVEAGGRSSGDPAREDWVSELARPEPRPRPASAGYN